MGTLLAAVALLVAPLRATIACDMSGPAGHPADAVNSLPAVVSQEASAGAHDAHAAHSEHVTPAEVSAEQAAQHPSAFSSEQLSPERSAPDGPMPAPCDDLASCAVAALPPASLARGAIVTPPDAPRVVIADALAAPVVGVDPPPPRT